MEDENINEQRTETLRKVEFDKGIPLSMDYPNNSVHSLTFSFWMCLFDILKKVFRRPNYILLIFLYIFFIIGVLISREEVMEMEILWPIIPPAVLIIIEIVFEYAGIFLVMRIDSETNSQKAQVYDYHKKDFFTVKWNDIKVGHLIKVERDEIVPADIIILEALDQNHNCYVDESSLTGVFDRYVIKSACTDTRSPIMKKVSIHDYIKNIKGMIKYDQPNMDMRKFNARLKLESFPRASGVTIENFILRGSSLKNTKGIYGLVVYTGMDTKIMQVLKGNSPKSGYSSSKSERNYLFTTLKKNQILFIIFYFIILGIYLTNIIYKYRRIEDNIVNITTYIGKDDNKKDLFYGLFQFILTFSLIIPYNWFNLIYIAYYILSKFIEYDVKVRISSKNTTEIINTDCLGDFGEVKYILADKTGTITGRKFDFKGLSFKGKFYLLEHSERKDEGLFKEEYTELSELEFYNDVKSKSIDSFEIRDFVEELAINHSVITWKNNKDLYSNNEMIDKPKEYLNNERKLGSAFGEEKAIMKVLEGLGYILKKATEQKVEIEVLGEKKKSYEILGRNKYTNSRKCSSLVYRKNQQSRESVMLCKAYDYSLLEKLNPDQNKYMVNLITDQVKRMSQLGYRFVILLKKELSEEETNAFIENYKSAESNMLQKDLLFENLAKGMETDMNIIGALFFEEVVSSSLKFAINKLNLADIHTWIISGDRSQNVEALAKNLDIVNCTEAEIVVFTEKDHRDDIDGKINSQLLTLQGKKDKSEEWLNKKHQDTKKRLTIFIHGKAMSTICNSNRLYQTFALLLVYTNNLFASGFTPKNKHSLTKMMKKFLCRNCKVLAIGDGLNDVMMLKEADLSIGIRSKEILQVKNTCDLIISQFSQITDLILVHGTWNLQRIKSIIYYSLYSSLVIILPFFYFNFFSEVYSFLKPDYLYLLLSLLITNFAITLAFCLNSHIERSIISISPHIYTENFQGSSHLFNLLTTVFKAIIDSLIIFYAFYMTYKEHVINLDGNTIDIRIQSLCYMISGYLVIYCKLLFLEIRTINVYNFLVVIISFAGVMTVGYIVDETFDRIIETLSFLTLMIYLFEVTMFCFLTNYCYHLYEFFFEESLTNNMIRLLNSITKNYDYLLDYDNYIMQLTKPEFPKERKEYTKFEDVIQQLNRDTLPLDSSIENRKLLNKIILILILYYILILKVSDSSNNRIITTKLRWDLKFKNSKMEYDYGEYFKNQNVLCFFYYLLVKVVFWATYMIIEGNYDRLGDIPITSSVQGAYILLGIILFLKVFKKSFYFWFAIYFYIEITIDIILIFVEDANNDTKACIQFIVTLLYPMLFGIRYLYAIVIGASIYFIGIFISLFFSDFDSLNSLSVYDYTLAYLPIILGKGLYILCTVLVFIMFGYHIEKNNRINFLKYTKKNTDKRKDDEIFDNLVPKFVQNKMKTGDRGTTNERETVTIIFANIAHFDDLVAKLNPRELVSLLDKLYGSFDKLSLFHGIQKIETVGYTYMAAGGLKECEKDMDENSLHKHHSIRAFELALDMIEIMSSIVLENGESVKLKIGIHTGKVLAGVIGEHKPQFSLIGDTVNTAARMGAKVQEMCVLCTQETYDIVKEEYLDFECIEKEFKGKGVMKCYQADPLKKKKENQDAKMKGFKNFLTKFLARAIQQVGGTDLKIEDLLKTNKTKVQPIQRQNSDRSNQSDFIVEDEFNHMGHNNHEYEEYFNIKKRGLSTKNDLTKTFNDNKNTLSVSKASETNPLFKNSWLLMNFDDSNEEVNNFEEEETTELGKHLTIEKNAEKLYERYSLIKFYNSYDITMLMNYCYLLTSLIAIFNNSEYSDTVNNNLLCSFLKILLLIALFYLVHRIKHLMKHKKSVIELSFILIYLLNIGLCQYKFKTLPDEFSLQIATEQNFTIVCLGFNSMIEYKKQFLCTILCIIMFIMNIIGNSHNDLIVKYSALSISISFCIFVFLILREYIGTFDYVKNQQVTTELLKAEKLLFNLMPPHVVISLKEDRTVADVINDVTILYTDICNFTKFSAAQKEQSNIVRMLIELFKRMDNACVELNVYKVHTIGDCFVVLGFTGKVPMNERNIIEEAKNVVKIGRKMIDIIRAVRETKEVNFPTLGMRIGIHTGKIIAGIIGSNIVRYDIFGSDCLVANMMESEGKEGRVNISEDTKRLLDMDSESKYTYSFNAKVNVPSTGREYDSYLVDFSN